MVQDKEEMDWLAERTGLRRWMASDDKGRWWPFGEAGGRGPPPPPLQLPTHNWDLWHRCNTQMDNAMFRVLVLWASPQVKKPF